MDKINEIHIEVRNDRDKKYHKLILRWYEPYCLKNDETPGEESLATPAGSAEKKEVVHYILKGQKIISDELLPVQMSDLKSLHLSWWYDMESLPLEICNLEALEEFHIDSCYNLKHFPTTRNFSNLLKNLRVLKISSCHCLEDISSLFLGGGSNLEGLEELEISKCYQLAQLPVEIGNLKRLRKLNLSCCSRLKDLPPTIGNLESLEEFSLEKCDSVANFPLEISNLKKNLRKLHISGVADRWDFKENFMLQRITNLENLQEMTINICGSFICLPTEEIGNLKCLRKLSILDCRNFEYLSPGVDDLEALQELTIIGCNELKDIPPEIGNLRCLRKLKIGPSEYFEQDELSAFFLRGLLESIPLQVGDLESLQEFDIHYCGCMERLSIVIHKLYKRHLLKHMNVYFAIRRYRRYGHQAGLNYSTGTTSPTTAAGGFMFDGLFRMTMEDLSIDLVGSRKASHLDDFLRLMSADNNEQQQPTTTSTPSSSSSSSSLSLLLPTEIKRIYFDDDAFEGSSIDQESILKLLQKYPRLGQIQFGGPETCHYNFTTDLLHMMYFNRFARGPLSQLLRDDTRNAKSPQRNVWKEALWATLLEEIEKKVHQDTMTEAINKSTDAEMINASIVYSILCELALPMLLERKCRKSMLQ